MYIFRQGCSLSMLYRTCEKLHGDRVLLNTPGLKIKRHAHDIGYAQSPQPETPIQYLQILWSMPREHLCQGI